MEVFFKEKDGLKLPLGLKTMFVLSVVGVWTTFGYFGIRKSTEEVSNDFVLFIYWIPSIVFLTIVYSTSLFDRIDIAHEEFQNEGQFISRNPDFIKKLIDTSLFASMGSIFVTVTLVGFLIANTKSSNELVVFQMIHSVILSLQMVTAMSVLWPEENEFSSFLDASNLSPDEKIICTVWSEFSDLKFLSKPVLKRTKFLRIVLTKIEPVGTNYVLTLFQTKNHHIKFEFVEVWIEQDEVTYGPFLAFANRDGFQVEFETTKLPERFDPNFTYEVKAHLGESQITFPKEKFPYVEEAEEPISVAHN